MAAVNDIESFYISIGSDIPLEEFKVICNSPFKFVKEVMNRGLLRDIRFEYFGVFEVSQSKIKHYKKSLEESFSNGTISETRYKDKMRILDSYENTKNNS